MCLFSGSATGWSASSRRVAILRTFLTLGSTSGVAGTDVLTIDYAQNTDLALREGVVTLTATGGTGTAQSVSVLTISQLGTGPNVVVSAPVDGKFSCTSCGRGDDCSGSGAYGRCYGLGCGG